MAEKERFAGLSYGQAGKLTYRPRSSNEDLGKLETSRNFSHERTLSVIGKSRRLYHGVGPSQSNRKEGLEFTRRTHERWLLQSIPGTFAGAQVLNGALTEALTNHGSEDTSFTSGSLLAFGNIANSTSLENGNRIPVIAVVCGRSGETLRIARLYESQWLWPNDTSARLSQKLVEPEDKFNETLWKQDSLPIKQLKFGSGTSTRGRVDWLFVQKDEYTTLLRPEYHTLPTKHDRFQLALSGEKASLINLPRLFTIHSRDTGGPPHSDCVFGAAGADAHWIGIIDVLGYWNIWTIGGSHTITHQTLHLADNINGHIDGVAKNNTKDYRAQRHGLLTCWPKTLTRDGNDSDDSNDEAYDMLASNATLLAWNGQRIEAFNPQTGAMLTRRKSIWESSTPISDIIDVQCSPVSNEDILILTKSNIIWVKLLLTADYSCSTQVILSISHGNMISDNTRMAICGASPKSSSSILVAVNSIHQILHLFWLDNEPGAMLPQFSRQSMQIPNLEQSTSKTLRQVRIVPLDVEYDSRAQPSSIGSDYARDQVYFYQVHLLGDDFELQYALCASSTNKQLAVKPPSTRVNYDMAARRRKWKRENTFFTKHSKGAFILPDGITELDLKAMFSDGPEANIETRIPEPVVEKPIVTQPKKFNMTRMTAIISRMLSESFAKGGAEVPPELYTVIAQKVGEGLDEGHLSVTSWLSILQSTELANTEVRGSITHEDIISNANDQVQFPQLKRFAKGESPRNSELSEILDYISMLWIAPLQRKVTAPGLNALNVWASMAARDLFLASYGVMVRPVLQPGGSASQYIPSSQLMPSSQAGPYSSQRSTQGTDSALERLRLLAVSVGDKVPVAKKTSIIHLWPEEPGTSLGEYVSSVTMATDDKFRGARERLLKREARRKSHVEKYGRLSVAKQSLPRLENEIQVTPMRPPPLQTMSSQPQAPNSSQTNILPSSSFPVPMSSQALPGAFSERKKKKAKRKSGFR